MSRTNTFKIIGNVADEPTFRPNKSDNGIVAMLRIATDRNPNSRRTEFLPVVAFGDTAETINSRVTTGTEIELIGNITNSAKYGLQLHATYVGVRNGALKIGA